MSDGPEPPRCNTCGRYLQHCVCLGTTLLVVQGTR